MRWHTLPEVHRTDTWAWVVVVEYIASLWPEVLVVQAPAASTVAVLFRDRSC